jgi:hypothetical protein
MPRAGKGVHVHNKDGYFSGTILQQGLSEICLNKVYILS